MNSNKKPLKLFISYSHIDENYLKNLEKHLITLKRRGIIEVWNDKKMTTGDILDNEIKTYLSSSDIIVFIVSVDFLNSWYCYEVELKETLARLKNVNIRVIPIIARACKWTDTELGKFLAATKDGKAIAKYDDSDEAWLEVVESIEKACSKLLEHSSNTTIFKMTTRRTAFFEQTDDFKKFLDDTGVVFQHNYKDKLNLNDVYIYPDLKNLKKEYNDLGKTINSKFLQDLTNLNSKVLILGDEQIGKTSLAKNLYSSFLQSGHVPLYCSGQDIKTTDPEELIGSISKNQYLEQSDIILHYNVLIVDDFEKIRLNTRHQPKFIERTEYHFSHIILISNSIIRFNEPTYVELSNFQQYEIMPFGHVLRGELIDKWNSIGNSETVNLSDLQKKNDIITHHIDGIIRKKIIPPKPFYILTVLQMLESSSQSDYSLTSYGHCYQSLIQSALLRNKIKFQELDTYINYLTELAFHFFSLGLNEIDNNELNSFDTIYSKRFLIESYSRIRESLLKAGILKSDGISYKFSYRYIFYFYVAKYLSEHIQEKHILDKIQYLADNIHTEKNANIIIFLVHHSKNQNILDEILFRALLVFEDFNGNEAKLDLNETKYLSKFFSDIPQLVAEHRNPEKERKKLLQDKDEIQFDSDEFDDPIDSEEGKGLLADINRSLRIIEIIGQILRNRYGSLEKEDLIELAQAACFSPNLSDWQVE